MMVLGFKPFFTAAKDTFDTAQALSIDDVKLDDRDRVEWYHQTLLNGVTEDKNLVCTF